MTDKRIIYTRPDGGMAIIIPAPKARGQILVEPEKRYKSGKLKKAAVYRDEADDEFLTRIAEKDVPTYRSFVSGGETEEAAKARMGVADLDQPLPYRFTDVSKIPADRTFRDAWKHENGAVKVCMDTARHIHMDRIRGARNQKLQDLDIETMKGRDVQKEKQILRDLPKKIDLIKAKIPDELKAIWPDELS